MRLYASASKVDTFDLKVLAAYLMVMDHLGIIFGLPSFRLVGRFALPIFGYLLVNGIRYTASYQNYYWRLLTFALISQVPYSIFHILNGIPINLNILFLFVCVYPLIYYYERERLLGVVVFVVPAIYLSRFCDYGLYGLWLLLVIYLTFKESIYVLVVFWFALTVHAWHVFGMRQTVVVLLLMFVPFLNNIAVGSKARWFYWFYPVHLVVLDILTLMVKW